MCDSTSYIHNNTGFNYVVAIRDLMELQYTRFGGSKDLASMGHVRHPLCILWDSVKAKLWTAKLNCGLNFKKKKKICLYSVHARVYTCVLSHMIVHFRILCWSKLVDFLMGDY